MMAQVLYRYDHFMQNHHQWVIVMTQRQVRVLLISLLQTLVDLMEAVWEEWVVTIMTTAKANAPIMKAPASILTVLVYREALFLVMPKMV